MTPGRSRLGACRKVATRASSSVCGPGGSRQRGAVAGRAVAAGGREQLAADGIADGGGQRAVLVLERDGGAPAAEAVEVVQRPVERVDDPGALAGALGALLAEVAVAGALARDQLDRGALGGPVDLGHDVRRRVLGAHAPGVALPGERDLRRGPGRGGGQLAVGHGRPARSCTSASLSTTGAGSTNG